MPSGYATGLVASNPSGADTVLCVEKPIIYGMTQAGRRWQRTLFPYLLRHGLVATECDPCVFTRPYRRRETVQTPSGPREETLIIGCYVDDLFTRKFDYLNPITHGGESIG